jgi:hypothetical protein
LDSLAVQRFIAGDDIMTVRAFKLDGLHNVSIAEFNKVAALREGG